ncbi:hypothetical protein RJT34_28521 [Clitoria ternatea]|uniref:Uncharacterized protein n=1 Tax=Clitoria ternatea TaxID=43366 RepID=A0AAN9FDZ8_CLITE
MKEKQLYFLVHHDCVFFKISIRLSKLVYSPTKFETIYGPHVCHPENGRSAKIHRDALLGGHNSQNDSED